MSFYVMIKNGSRTGLLAGPFDTREAAIPWVEPARKVAREIDRMAWFMEFGTVSVSSIYGIGKPYGRLNKQLGLPTAPADNSVLATVESGYRQAVAARAAPTITKEES